MRRQLGVPLAVGAVLLGVALLAVVALDGGRSDTPPASPGSSPTATAAAPATATPSPDTSSTAAPATPSPTTPAGAPTATPPPGEPAPPSRVAWNGRDWYLFGANLPWYNWACDFGCNADGGASSQTVRAALAPRLAELRQAGIHNLRWWLFPGDPWQITRDAAGAPVAIDPAVYADVDAALAMAETNGLYLTFTLFSAPSHLPGAWLSDPAQRERLADVLGDLFAHYAGHPRILAWEVVNEPEWDIWSGLADEDDVRELVRLVAEQVHERGGGPLVTVGGAMLDGLPMWVGLGLDFHSPHWYDYMDAGDWCAVCTTAADVEAKYGLDAPVVLGEVYAGSDADPAARLADFYARGYAGAWAWSLFPERTEDNLAIDLPAAAAFAATTDDNGPD